jgi:peptidoglycan/xylan/chitin deacetylase (PgdA/CDA1 family)
VLGPAAALLALGACSGPPEDDEKPNEPEQPGSPGEIFTEQEAATTFPVLDFSNRPTYLASNAVVLTFDDGPDDTNTAQVLDVLKSAGVTATFFVNTINFTDVNTDPTAQALIRRMVNEGHEIGNHTVHHLNLGTLTAAQIESEIAGVENTVRPLIGSRRLTILRAPFGIPFNPNDDTSQIGKVGPVVAKHAVHVGWNIDSEDSGACVGDSTCIFNTVTSLLKPPGGGAGSYGIILMHATSAATVAALPNLINFMKTNGFVFRKVEDAVRGRFGSTTASAEQVDNLLAHLNRPAAADAFVRDGTNANTNFGTATTLEVKTSSTGNNRDAYLRFDISAATTISKAKLRIFARSSNSTNLGVSLFSVASTTWSETAITWNTRPARGSTALSSTTVGGTSIGAYDLDVTGYVKGQKAAAKSAVSFALHCPSTVNPVARFNARESGNSRPQLVITP